MVLFYKRKFKPKKLPPFRLIIVLQEGKKMPILPLKNQVELTVHVKLVNLINSWWTQVLFVPCEILLLSQNKLITQVGGISITHRFLPSPSF